MRRRKFLKHTALSSVLLALPRKFISANKSHIISFSFDDGFRKSFYRVAEIHENYGTKACLNIIASAHFDSFQAIDEWILPSLMGDFEDWNALKSRGHEVMPHTWEHLNLTKISQKKAKKNIDKCLDYFENNLEGYKPEEAIYNFAFNASTPELEEHALQRVRAVRTWGRSYLNEKRANPEPSVDSRVLGCTFHGPDYGDDFVEKTVQNFLSSEGGWLILNLHGLDGEGWGPLHSDYYDGLLKRLVEKDEVSVQPVGEILSLEP